MPLSIIRIRSQGSLTEGKVQYCWPPCTNLFTLAAFSIENFVYLFYKTSQLNEEVNCTIPPLSVRFPWPNKLECNITLR
jgi:hypothetical protein